jgi:hypothetical protein
MSTASKTIHRFCFDTNAFIEPWHRRYPLDMFPRFWDQLESLGEDGIILAPEEVLHELSKIDDDLWEWAKARKYLFHSIDDAVQNAMLSIMRQFPRLVDTKKGRNIADPWVIAQAQVTSAIVVTEETPARGNSPKIPDVCEALGIPWTNLLQFMRSVNMSFQ